MKQNRGCWEGLLTAQTLFMKLINCPGAKHHGHQSLQNGRRREVRKGGRERSGTERQGQGLEGGGGREWGVGSTSAWKVDSGNRESTQRTQIFSQPRPRSLALRDAAHPGPRMAMESRLSCRLTMLNKCE